ncbi:hypothetical protein [Citricoccus sp. K5]|uniref:hypothetical protein n=1 Tax=Citricoccus sp. K5 TaxID=2653135 RepID=UPI0012F27714|nr:hypothetical protein [Citricoccus sp. K5]VXB24465.1 conserved hypothetical protein [Citricoccus sp. K5]
MTTTDPRARLAAIKARAEAATEGPWEFAGDTVEQLPPGGYEEIVSCEVSCGSYCYGGTGRGVIRSEDGEFIAHARTDVDDMAAAITAVLDLCDDWEARAPGVSGPEVFRRTIADALGTDQPTQSERR